MQIGKQFGKARSNSITMKTSINYPLIVLGLFGFLSNSFTVEAYNAAVVAYNPLFSTDWTLDEVVTHNVNYTVKRIIGAKDKAEIIIFPEYGFTRIDAKDLAKEHLSIISILLDQNINPCDNSDKVNGNLFRLSCASRNANMYSVFSVVEKDEKDKDSSYLTSVVLDNTGKIALKCRRNYLPPESRFSKSKESKPCVFTANFKSGNKTFLLIHDPGVLDQVQSRFDGVILTSAVKNTAPFHYAPSIHAGFAAKNRVNLLVSGYLDPDKSYGGTGIYNIDGNKLKANVTLGAMGPSTDYVVYREVVTKEPANKIDPIQTEVTFNIPNKMNIPFADIPMKSNETNQCVRDVCCSYTADNDQQNISPYEWVVFYKNTTIFSRPVEIVYCALIKPEKGPTMSFKNVTINTKYSETQVRQVLPIAIKNDFKVPFFAYQETQTNSSLYLTQKEELISFGIIHVLKDPNSASRIGYLAPSFILVSVLLWISI